MRDFYTPMAIRYAYEEYRKNREKPFIRVAFVRAGGNTYYSAFINTMRGSGNTSGEFFIPVLQIIPSFEALLDKGLSVSNDDIEVRIEKKIKEIEAILEQALSALQEVKAQNRSKSD